MRETLRHKRRAGMELAGHGEHDEPALAELDEALLGIGFTDVALTTLNENSIGVSQETKVYGNAAHGKPCALGRVSQPRRRGSAGLFEQEKQYVVRKRRVLCHAEVILLHAVIYKHLCLTNSVRRRPTGH